jgi:hypothetical protein
MLCKNPFMKEGIPLGCGQCLPCRINKRRIWATRLALEAQLHENVSFITLTYSDENLFNIDNGTVVLESGLPQLNPDHVQKFIKKIRRALEPQKLRMFYVGEYGTETWRPHYHILLFGYPPCKYGQPKIKNIRRSYEKHGKGWYKINQCECKSCQLVQNKWQYGFTKTEAPISGKNIANYVCGYVTKKITNANNEQVQQILEGRHPEFSRMSNRQGIGYGALEAISEALKTPVGLEQLALDGDVPNQIAIGDKLAPLGGYLREKLREKIYTKEEIQEIKEKNLQKLQKEAQEEAWEDYESGKYEYLRKKKGGSYDQKDLIIEKNKQKSNNLVKKFKRRNNGGQL